MKYYISVVVSLFVLAFPVNAEILPDKHLLIKRIGFEPQPVKVYEPHLDTTDGKTEVTYLGWPFEAVASSLFGADWQSMGDTVNFRALDGYVANISVLDFEKHSAWLVNGVSGNLEFKVDNLLQNEKDIELGPYYLVWENITDELIQERGASIWPYQVDSISLISLPSSKIRPRNLESDLLLGADIAEKYCLNCHVLNGFGGKKVPEDLAALTKSLDSEAFNLWVLDPRAVDPETTMPAMAPLLTESERLDLANNLFLYLSEMTIGALHDR